MFKAKKCAVAGLILAMSILFVPALRAQEPPEVPAAPIPAQILTGKKAFISNGESTAATGIPNLTYNEFYAAMKTWGRYELVATPADADLVFEIRFVAPAGPVNVMGGSGGSAAAPQFRLLILDPKSRVVLWPFSEHVENALRAATARKNFEEAMSNLVEDVKKLVAGPGGDGKAETTKGTK
jgi:hypothetical protein